MRSATVPLSTGGRLHRFHAQPQRTGPGWQEEGGALRLVLGEGALHCTVCHCTGTFDPGEGPIRTDVGELTTSAKGYFFIPTEYLQSDQPLFFFMDILMGRKYTDRIKSDFMYLPKTLWLHMWNATPYTVSMQYWPLLRPVWGVWNWMTPLIKDGGVSPQGSKSSSIVPALLIISMRLLYRQTPVPIFFYSFFMSQAQEHPEYCFFIS